MLPRAKPTAPADVETGGARPKAGNFLEIPAHDARCGQVFNKNLIICSHSQDCFRDETRFALRVYTCELAHTTPAPEPSSPKPGPVPTPSASSHFRDYGELRSLQDHPEITAIQMSTGQANPITDKTNVSQLRQKWLSPLVSDPEHPLLLKDCTMIGTSSCPRRTSWAGYHPKVAP